MAFYVLDENHNLIEAYDKEGVLAVIEKAIADGSLSGLVADASFVTQLKCCVSGQTNKIAFVTQAKYNELAKNNQTIANCYYYITDDTTLDEIDEMLVSLNNMLVDIHEGKTPMIQRARTADQLLTETVAWNAITKVGLYAVTVHFDVDGRNYNMMLSVENLDQGAYSTMKIAEIDLEIAIAYSNGRISIQSDNSDGQSISSIRLITAY